MPTCSIIIPTYNNSSLLEKCLESIFRNTEYPHFEVLVVDNHSTDATAAFLKNPPHAIRSIVNNDNLGFAKACNLGAAQAKGEVLVFLNNDTEVLPGWLTPLMEDLRDPEIGITGSKLLFADQTIQHAGIAFTYNNIPYHLFRGFPSTYRAANIRREMRAVTGACMAVKKALFQECGTFDEGYINGLEDIDLCLKAKARNQKVMYNPQSLVHHFESKTAGRYAHADANKKKFLSAWNKVQLWDDYRYFLTDRALGKDDPDGVHIILHFPCPQGPYFLFQHIFRQLYLVQGRFRFSILKCFKDPLMDYVQQLLKGALTIMDYSATSFERALVECAQNVASPFVFLIESNKFFYGNMDLLFSKLQSLKNTAIGIPFSQKPALDDLNSCLLKEAARISHPTVFFTKDILINRDEDFFSMLNSPLVEKFETTGYCTMPEGSFGI